MAKHLGIIGYPLAHSISPAFQQAALDHYGLPARYASWPTPPEGLSDRVNELRGEEYLGANVTIPHKERVRQMLDGVDSWARVVGAVNTIVMKGGELIGHNTDAYGFVRSLKEKAGFEPEDRSVLLLGAGGAARAAAFGLAELLGLDDMMPVTVERRWNGKRGALSWWLGETWMCVRI